MTGRRQARASHVLTVDFRGASATALSEALTPEEATAALATLHAALGDDDARHDGWVVVDTPDGLRVVHGSLVATFRVEPVAGRRRDTAERPVITPPE